MQVRESRKRVQAIEVQGLCLVDIEQAVGARWIRQYVELRLGVENSRVSMVQALSVRTTKGEYMIGASRLPVCAKISDACI